MVEYLIWKTSWLIKVEKPYLQSFVPWGFIDQCLNMAQSGNSLLVLLFVDISLCQLGAQNNYSQLQEGDSCLLSSNLLNRASHQTQNSDFESIVTPIFSSFFLLPPFFLSSSFILPFSYPNLQFTRLPFNPLLSSSLPNAKKVMYLSSYVRNLILPRFSYFNS